MGLLVDELLELVLHVGPCLERQVLHLRPPRNPRRARLPRPKSASGRGPSGKGKRGTRQQPQKRAKTEGKKDLVVDEVGQRAHVHGQVACQTIQVTSSQLIDRQSIASRNGKQKQGSLTALGGAGSTVRSILCSASLRHAGPGQSRATAEGGRAATDQVMIFVLSLLFFAFRFASILGEGPSTGETRGAHTASALGVNQNLELQALLDPQICASM